jgi:hypothetical protein
MFSKFMTLILALSLFSVSAMANTNDGLKAAFEEFNYSINVEWDQKDASFLEAKKLELTQAINALEAEGMTRLELITFAKSQIKDAALAKSLDSLIEAVALNTMTAVQAQAIMTQALEKSQSAGANWDGAFIVITPFGLLILVLVILAID